LSVEYFVEQLVGFLFPVLLYFLFILELFFSL